MNFNSVVFLFCFMPLALGLYYLVPGRVKNAVLLVESLLFFCWGGITWLPLAVGMVAINYAAGLLLASLPAGGKRKIVLIAAIVLTRWPDREIPGYGGCPTPDTGTLHPAKGAGWC